MPPTIALIFMLSLLIFRLLTTVIHELGHAIPALLLTKEKVTVYMGSHGDPEKSIQFQIGRLECFFKFNLFYWKGGLCVMSSKEISVHTDIIVTLFGPLFSLIVAGIGILCINFGDFSDVTVLVLFALVFSCALDFIHNIIPNPKAVVLHDGVIVHNDGMQLLNLFKYENVSRKYTVGVHHYHAKEYEKAAAKFEEVLAVRSDHAVFYRLALFSNLSIKNYDKAKEIQNAFKEKFEAQFQVSDYINLGILQNYYNEYEKALETYTKALKIDPKNALILNNRGYALGLLDTHEEAIVDLDTSIELDQEFAFAWNNRGFSKLKIGQLEDGLQDIEKSLELDAKNAYAYRNVGLYHFYKKDYQKALELYKKAFEMDKSVYKIQEYIDEVNRIIKL
jgi:tetratricopeptide (TPR) repeat protein